MGSKTKENGYQTIIIIFLLIFCSGIIYFSYLSRPDNFTRRQVRTVICAREMIASGNYIIPTLGGETRFRKPPLPYWLICLNAKLNNNQITNITSRVPSVVAGILILLLTWWWTFQIKRDGNHKKALLSPLILIIIPLFYLDVRSSEAEIALCFFILAASYFFWKASLEKKTSGKNFIFAYLFIAGGFLTKGPLALIMPILPYILVRQKNFLREWKWHSIGFLIATIPVGLWVLAAYIYYPESINVFIKELFIKRFGGEAKHAEPFYYYILLLVAQFAVFVPVLFPAIKEAFRNKTKVKFNLYFILLNLVWLSMMSSKQKHYIIPIFPHLSIIVGVWLSEQVDKKWILHYFKVISYILAGGVIVFGFVLLPKSILILLSAAAFVIIVTFLSRCFLIPNLWRSAIFILALMHLADLFVTHTGNRLQYEQLMAKWIQNQPISNNKIVFVKRPKGLLAFYFDYLDDYVSPNDKEITNMSDYFIVEGEDRIERFINDNRFYLVKGIDKIKKGEKEHQIALFGKMTDEKDNYFNYRLLFLSGDGNGSDILQNHNCSSGLNTYYAIIPEINPLISLGLFTLRNRMKWDQRYLPIVNQGVELICKFDPGSSLYRKTWFNDAMYWGVTPEILQRRSFFNDRYFLWTIERIDFEKTMNQLEDELKESSSLQKFVFIQSSTLSKRKEIPDQYIKRLKAVGAIIVNELIEKDTCGVILSVSYDNSVEIQTMGSNGQITTSNMNMFDRKSFEKKHQKKRGNSY